MNTKRTHVRILSLLLCLSMILGMAPMVQLFTVAKAAEISGAVSALEAGEYTLTGDATLSAALTISGDVTIDLAGHTLTGVAVPFITVPEGAKLTVKDSAAGGKIQGLAEAAAAQDVVILVTGGEFVLESGAVTGHYRAGSTGAVTTRGGVIGVTAGSFVMNGGEISNNYSALWGNVYINNGSFIMNGGEIIDNSTGARGGALCFEGAEAVVKINGGKIGKEGHPNSTTQYGGAIYGVSGVKTFELNGGEIRYNKVTRTDASKYAGAGIYYNGTFTMNGGLIANNSAGHASAAGAIHTSASTFIMTGGTIRDNGAVGVNLAKASTVDISGSAVIDSGAVRIVADQGTLKIHDLESDGNIIATVQATSKDESVTETTISGGFQYTGNIVWNKLSGEVSALAEGNNRLTGDASLTAGVTISGDVVLDLNGKTLTGVAAPFITVPTGAKLTIKDSGIGGKIQGIASATDVMVLVSGGEFVLESGIMTGHTQASSKDGGAVRVEDGKFTMNGGAITGNTISSRWGTVYVGKGIVEINDGEITNNKAGRGGALCARTNAASIVINGGKISGNTAQYGGAIYFLDQASLTINGGEISNNKADHATAKAQGGAIFGGGTLTITGGLITGNDAKSGSPAVHATGTVFTMTGGTIKDNGTTEPASNIIKQGTPALDSTTVISGNPVIEGQAINIVGSYTIENLTEGAYIFSQTEAGTTDKTVAVTNAGGKFLYTDAYKADTKWNFFTDDFEGYTVGENTFASELDSAYYTALKASNGQTYGIVKDGDNSYLKMSHENPADAATIYNYFLYSHGISGAYTMEFDFRFENEGAGWILNMLEGYSFPNGKPMLAYINNYGAYICDQATDGTNIYHYVKNAHNENLIPAVGTWYSLKMTLDEGQMVLKVWEKGTQEPVEGAGVAVCEAAVINEAALEAAHSIRLRTRSAKGAALSISMDNLKLSKVFGAENPETIIAEVGDKLEAKPLYTVNDLSLSKPFATYKYTVSDSSLVEDGYCKAEGVADLTIELLDVKGNPTGVTYTTQLVIGNSYGIDIGEDIKVPESDIGKEHQLTVTPNANVTLPEGYSIQWTTDDPSVVTVDATGKLTYVAFGNTAVTAQVLDKNGKATLYYAKINVQVGDTPLRVLSIGNSFSRDSLNYISSLAGIYDLRVEAAYLMLSSGTIREHAMNLANRTPAYSWYTTNAATGEMKWREGDVTISQKVESQDWDIIILHQGVVEAGFPGTYNEDLRYLLDYIADVQPDAKVYWNMTWALQEDFGTGKHGTDFQKFYKGNPLIQYNAFVDTLDEFIAGEDAVFGADFDGWFPTGVAIQNLRGTIDHDLDLTRDGFHLSLDIGRLTASMTLLKTIYPELDLSKITADKVAKFIVTDKKDCNGFTTQVLDTDESEYTYTEADLPKIIAAVEAACASDKIPAKKDVSKTSTATVAEKYENSVIMGQETLPLLMHFPDTKVTSDGTVWSCAYVNVSHYPRMASRESERLMYEGAGELVIWTGKQDYTSAQWQESYEAPALVLTQELLEKWGCTQISGRYELLKNNSAASYTVMADPRDGNFGVAFADMDGDGDKEEVVLFTFWIRYYDQNGAQTIGNRLFMTWATQDANGKWVWKDGCQELKANGSAGGVKRGDITSFSDGTILIPCYGRTLSVPAGVEYAATSAYNMYMKFDAAKGEWVEIYSYAMPNFDAAEAATINEVSLIVPDPDGDVVYAMIREAGTVVVSNDRGKTWEYVANEAGKIHQPGFTVIDEERVFVTWAIPGQPRPTFGKVFYINADWNDSQTQLIYAPGTPHGGAASDAADPSCALLPNGKVLVISYDTSYQAIVGVIEDPNDEKYQLIELSENEEDVYVVYESDADKALSATNAIPENVKTYGTYTVEAQVKIDSANGTAVIATAAGSVNVTGDAGDVINVIVKSVGGNNFVKMWAEGEKEPADWTVTNKGTASAQPSVTGSGATLLDITVSDRIRIDLEEITTLTVGDPAVVLNYEIYPATGEVTFKSGDDKIVKVDAAGKLTPVAAGKTTVTVTVNGYADAQCTIVVLPAPAELSGTGTANTILWDDFEEDKYTAGDNAVWNHYWKDPSKSFYFFQNAANMTQATDSGKYNVVADGENQYMVMTGKTTWIASAAEITGNYTVSFDVMFSKADQSLNLTMWQNELFEADGKTKTKGNEIHAFVNLQADKSRYQYRAESLFVDSSTSSNPNLYCNGDNTLVDSTVYDTTAGAINVWQSVKMTRIDGGLYLKVWNKYNADGSLAAEPTAWTCVLNHGVLDADIPSHFRMQFDCSKDTAQTCAIDNLKITQQTPDTVKVTFQDGTEKLSEQTLEAGRLATKPADPTKEGYTFIGWYNGDKAWDFATEPVMADMTLTAKWKAHEFTVTIGGEESGAAYGDKLTKPADPVKEGYTFVGWYNGDKKWDFETDTVTGNVELVAKFEINKYTVTINGVEQTVEHGAKLTKPADPVKEGYTFVGWYVGDKAWNFETDTVTGDLELTAKWEVAQSGSGSGGSGSGSDEPSKTEDRAMPMAFALLVMLSVCGLTVIVTGKKKLF